MGFVRLNDPVAYGDPEDSDDELLERAGDSLTVEGLDEEYLDLGVETIQEGEDAIGKVVYLYTLIEDTEENPASERITNDAVDGEGRHSLEGGIGCEYDGYWEHLQGSWSFEGIVYNGQN